MNKQLKAAFATAFAIAMVLSLLFLPLFYVQPTTKKTSDFSMHRAAPPPDDGPVTDPSDPWGPGSPNDPPDDPVDDPPDYVGPGGSSGTISGSSSSGLFIETLSCTMLEGKDTDGSQAMEAGTLVTVFTDQNVDVDFIAEADASLTELGTRLTTKPTFLHLMGVGGLATASGIPSVLMQTSEGGAYLYPVDFYYELDDLSGCHLVYFSFCYGFAAEGAGDSFDDFSYVFLDRLHVDYAIGTRQVVNTLGAYTLAWSFYESLLYHIETDSELGNNVEHALSPSVKNLAKLRARNILENVANVGTLPVTLINMLFNKAFSTFLLAWFISFVRWLLTSMNVDSIMANEINPSIDSFYWRN